MSTKPSSHAAPLRAGGKPLLVDRGKQFSMSVQTKIVIVAILVGFAILHAIGFTLIRSGSDGAPVEAAHMYGAD